MAKADLILADQAERNLREIKVLFPRYGLRS
jgi:hypothetical protein